MNRSQPSIRLKQISRIISRQQDDVAMRVTSSCVAVVMILLIIFLAGIAMITAGALIFNACTTSWLPTWLWKGPACLSSVGKSSAATARLFSFP